MRGAVVFDLDGTLVDTALDIGDALSRVMVEAGLAPASEVEVRAWVGDGGAALLRRAWRARGAALGPEDVPARLERFRDLYAERPVAASAPYPGVREALAALAAHGIPIAVCTNKPRLHTELVLGALGLRDGMAAVVAGDDLPVRKPHPDHLRAALRGAGADRGVLVGDGTADLGAARAAGVPFVAVGWGYGPRSVVDEADAVCDAGADLASAVLPWLAQRPPAR